MNKILRALVIVGVAAVICSLPTAQSRALTISSGGQTRSIDFSRPQQSVSQIFPITRQTEPTPQSNPPASPDITDRFRAFAGQANPGSFTSVAQIAESIRQNPYFYGSSTIYIVEKGDPRSWQENIGGHTYNFHRATTLSSAMVMASTGDLIALPPNSVHFLQATVMAKPGVHIYGPASSMIVLDKAGVGINLSGNNRYRTLYSGFMVASVNNSPLTTGISVNNAWGVLLHDLRFLSLSKAKLDFGVKINDSDEVLVTGSLFNGMGGRGIDIDLYDKEDLVAVYNNDFIRNTVAYEMATTTASTFRLVNNAFYDSVSADISTYVSSGHDETPTLELQNNGFFNYSHDYTDPDRFYRHSGRYPRSIGTDNLFNVNPIFRQGTLYSLAPASPYRETGWRTDYWHNMFSPYCDIGWTGGANINLWNVLKSI